MTPGDPQAAGHAVPVGPTRAHGRARVVALADDRSLWRLPGEASALAERLRWLGEHRVGGFEAAGVDGEGVWLVRGPTRPSLRDHLKDPPLPPPVMLGVFAQLARCLEFCERHSVFPGPLRADDVVITGSPGEPCVTLMAEAMVASLLAASSSAAIDVRFVPPAQAEGAPFDAAANRYVLGLLLYRALAGEHAFAGKGLRLGWADAARRGAPPLPSAVAGALPPGLQSLVLRLLDPDPGARPPGAAAIAERLIALGAGAAEPTRAPVTILAMPAAEPSRTTEADEGARVGKVARGSARRFAWGWAGPLLCLAVAGVAATAALPPRTLASAPSAPSAIASTRPLSSATLRPDDCASCHPVQTAQWHGSVMAHAARSPLFEALEILIEEQAGRAFDCPHGAGILRTADPATACRDRTTQIAITGSGGEHWCVNCHTPGETLAGDMPAWDGVSASSRSRQPLRDLLPASTLDGISCAFCHQVHGPVEVGAARRGGYEGNPSWTSPQTGAVFAMRPEDRTGLAGIANSGYQLDPFAFVGTADESDLAGGVHRRPRADARAYLQSSEFCGACHDVRLFGTDALAGGFEHFKRLRNAYSEWTVYAEGERASGRTPASCQDCHMSNFPGICAPGPEPELARAFAASVPTAVRRACPPGTHFEARPPGSRPSGFVATGSAGATEMSTHYLTGVDIPLDLGYPEAALADPSLDPAGVPRGANARRDLLLGASFRFELDAPGRRGGRLSLPVVLENVGAGHRIPAGFSQEREFWVHLRVEDATGSVVYEVGRVDRGDEDLHDKEFVRVNVDDRVTDSLGQPLGVFGADVADGRDVPRWRTLDARGSSFEGRGLINLQNGFLRCVTCIGVIDGQGECQPGPGQGLHRADRFGDGAYDPDTGECGSNLRGEQRFFEVYFPVGALDAERGVLKGPDAIVDTRSAPAGVPLRYRYDLDVRARPGPYRVTARLMFRAFPPFLLRAFIQYEALQAARGLRPSGPLITEASLARLEALEIARVETSIP